MLREACEIDMEVYFGRPNGERTLGRVVKMNRKTAKVRSYGQRGHGQIANVGLDWTVPYGLMTPKDVGVKPPTNDLLDPKVLVYNPFNHIENLILEAILCVYGHLSPTNTMAEEGKPFCAIVPSRYELNRQLRGLQAAYGREVGDVEIYGWWGRKMAYAAARKTK